MAKHMQEDVNRIMERSGMRYGIAEDTLTDAIFYNTRLSTRESGSKAEARAQARLMLAAPALLEACETAYANLRNSYASDHLVIKQLTAAIAQARGEEVTA